MNKKELDFKFLDDRPTDTGQPNYFDFYHSRIAPALKTILLNESCVHTLGLFGGWGSGKSTIIRELKRDSDTKLKIVEFDSWKYQEDSFRRQFLFELAIGLGLSKKYVDNLDKKFYSSISEDIKEKIDISWSRLGKILIFASVFFLAIFAYSILQNPNLISSWKSIFSTSFYLIIGTAGIVTLLDKFFLEDLKNIIKISSITATRNKLESPEEFESCFVDILKNAKQKDVSAIVLVIDNLDRVDPKVALKILSTLKTFLEIDSSKVENKKIIFLVPVDCGAIKTAVSDEKWADEFLRKIFNLIVWSPEFIKSDFESYAKELISQTGELGKSLLNDDVLLVINSAFSNNPREIKQYVNNLVASLVLAEYTEVKKEIKANVAFLAKLNVLNQKFPDYYKELKDNWADPSLIKLDALKNINELRDFLSNTSRILDSNPRPFLYFKKPVATSGLKNSENLESALVGGDKDTALMIIKANKNEVGKLADYIRNLLSEYKNYKQAILNIFRVHIEVFDELKIIKKITSSNYYNDLCLILDRYLWQDAPLLWVDKIFSIILKSKYLSEENRKLIINRYLISLSDPQNTNDEFRVSVLTNLIKYKDLLGDQDVQVIKQTMESNLSKNMKFMEIFDSKEKQTIFVTATAFKEYIKTIDSLTVATKFDLVKSYKDYILEQGLLGDVVSQMSDLLSNEISKNGTLDQIKEKIIDNLCFVYREFQIDEAQKDFAYNMKVFDLASQLFASVENNMKYRIVILLSWLGTLLSEPSVTEINRLIAVFFSGGYENGDKLEVLKYWKSHTKLQSLIAINLPTMFPSLTSDFELFSSLYDLVNIGDKEKILDYLINNQSDYGIGIFGKKQFSRFSINKIISKLLVKSVGLVPYQNRTIIYNYISQNLDIYDEKENIVNSIKQIEGLLLNSDIDAQEIGYKFFVNCKFITNLDKKELAVKIIDQLGQPGLQLYPDYYSLKYVMLIFNDLRISEKVKFVSIVFANIKEGMDQGALDLWWNYLVEIKPYYSRYGNLFRDFRNRLELWNNADMKLSIANKFLVLKSEKPSKNELDFWREVEKIISNKST